jgi:hypothetical protein
MSSTSSPTETQVEAVEAAADEYLDSQRGESGFGKTQTPIEAKLAKLQKKFPQNVGQPGSKGKKRAKKHTPQPAVAAPKIREVSIQIDEQTLPEGELGEEDGGSESQSVVNFLRSTDEGIGRVEIDLANHTQQLTDLASQIQEVKDAVRDEISAVSIQLQHILGVLQGRRERPSIPPSGKSTPAVPVIQAGNPISAQTLAAELSRTSVTSVPIVIGARSETYNEEDVPI